MGRKKYGKCRESEQQAPVTRKRRKTTGEHAGGSESMQPGVHEPQLQAEPVPTLPAEFFLFEKYQTMTVLCDKKDELPTRAYFVQKMGGWKRMGANRVEPVDKVKEDFFELIYHDDVYIGENLCGTVQKGLSSSLVPPRLLGLKGASSPKIHNADLDAVLALFEDLGRVLRYGENGNWIADEVPFRNHLKKIDELFDENPVLATKYQDGDLLRAFCKRMNSSAGKNALKHIIDMALIVSFGRKAIRRSCVTCNLVRKQPRKTERFPDLYYEGAGASEAGTRSVSPGCSDLSATDKVKQWIADDVWLGASESCASEALSHGSDVTSDASSVHYVKLPDDGICADIVSVSGCEPNWPHFLLIGEVNSSSEGTFSEASKSQLVREMLGTMLHQSVVFGVMISDTRALLCSMNLDFDNKKIHVTFLQYGFLCGISLREFSHISLTRLFLDLVDVLNFSKANTKEVCHWPLPNSA